MTATLLLSDGRALEYLVAGPADATPLVMHNGAPSGVALLFEPMVAIAAQHRLRIVCLSRPGYAGSTPQSGRTVAAVAADVSAVLDHLGGDRFLTVGWSGGGPHALACAALLPGRCAAAATVAGLAPHAAEGLDWLDGLATAKEFGVATAGEAALTGFLEPHAVGLAGVQADQVAAGMGDLASEVDRAALTGEFADYLARCFRKAVSTGIAGWRDDDLALVSGWGFDLAAVQTPVSVWHGAEDRMVPYSHGRWLADRLPDSRPHLEPAEGHLSMIRNRFDDILSELTAHLS